VETHATIYTRACQFIQQCDYAGALRDFVWLHDNPTVGDPASEVFRRAYGFQAWGQLGNVYPPAKEKMRELLDLNIAILNAELPSKAIESDISAMKRALASADSGQ